MVRKSDRSLERTGEWNLIVLPLLMTIIKHTTVWFLFCPAQASLNTYRVFTVCTSWWTINILYSDYFIRETSHGLISILKSVESLSSYRNYILSRISFCFILIYNLKNKEQNVYFNSFMQKCELLSFLKSPIQLCPHLRNGFTHQFSRQADARKGWKNHIWRHWKSPHYSSMFIYYYLM